MRIGNSDASSTDIGKAITDNDLCYRTANPKRYNKGLYAARCPAAIKGKFISIQNLPEAGNGPLHMVEVDFKYIDHVDYGESKDRHNPGVNNRAGGYSIEESPVGG